MQDWDWMVFQHLIHGIWSLQFLGTRIRTMIERGDPLWTQVKFVFHLTRFTNASNLEEWSMIYIMWILFLQTSNFLIWKLCCMCLKTTKQWSRWSQREEARRWDMFPEPTELLLIDCLIESMWTLKIQIKYIDTKNQLADTLTKRNFTCDAWNHLLCLLINISHFSSINSPKLMSKRTQKESGEKRVTAKSKPMMNLVSRCSERNSDVLASTASESPVKTRHESQFPLSSWPEQHHRTLRHVVFAQHTDRFMVENDNMDSYTEAESEMSLKSRSFLHRVNDQVRKRQLKTLTHRATQNEMLIRLDLLKSGNLMNWWKLELGNLLMNSHPVCSHSTRTDLLLMTLIWTLTPSQNQTFR